MKVVHYLFGLPPVRIGGVPKYAIDLMRSQREAGFEVKMLIPGSFTSFHRDKVRIVKWKKVNKIPCFRIMNAQYVPNGFGIAYPEAFMKECDVDVYVKWLELVKPDMLHIHSLMGLHIELLRAAKQMNIPILYVTHDYFGLCPKIDLLKGTMPCLDKGWENCEKCCIKAYTLKRLKLEQSPYYWVYCHCKKIMTLVHKVKIILGGKEKVITEGTATNCDKLMQYKKLQQYYHECFQLVDIFHFNSKQSRMVYEERLGYMPGEVIPITNLGINDRRNLRSYGATLRLGYLGSAMPLKGYNYLLEALELLYKSGRQNFILNTYVEEGNDLPFVYNHTKFSRKEQDSVYGSMDLLIVPSICQETFGMVVLEALSYGIPVLVSENVGARMLLEDNPGVGIIFSLKDQDLLNHLIRIYDDRDLLKEMNNKIVNCDISFSYEEHMKHVEEMYDICRKSV